MDRDSVRQKISAHLAKMTAPKYCKFLEINSTWATSTTNSCFISEKTSRQEEGHESRKAHIFDSYRPI